MIVKKLLVWVLFLFSVSLCLGQKSMMNDKAMHEIILKGLDKTYNFEFDEAEKFYNQVKTAYPDHPAYNFLLASQLYWKMLYYDNYQEKASEYFGYLKESLAQAAKFLQKNSKDPEGIFFSMAAESSIALYYAERDDDMKSLTHAKKAYVFMKEGFDLKDKYSDFYFSTGLYDYFVVKYPEVHPFYKPFMGFFAKGNKQRGIEELIHATSNGVFSRSESIHYLTNIFLKYEDIPEKAVTYSEQLVKKYPNNYYFISRHTEGLIRTQKYKQAEVYAYQLFKTGKNPFIMRSYVFYGMLNESHFKKPDEAIRYYNSALTLASKLTQPLGDYVSFCYAGLGRVYAGKGEKEKAREYYKKARQMGEYAWVRKESDEFLKKNQ